MAEATPIGVAVVGAGPFGLSIAAHLEKNGVDVLGVTDHGMFHSIYFFDPSGHRVELACPDPDEEEQLKQLDAVPGVAHRDMQRRIILQ